MKPVAALLALLSLTLLAPGLAQAKKRADPPPEPCEEQEAVQTLRRLIAAEELLIALELRGDQKAALADLVREGLEEREARRAERKRRAPDAEALLEDYLAELRADGAPAQDTTAALRALRAERREGREGNAERRREAREALRSILDEGQREALLRFRPMRDAAEEPDEEARAAREERRQERMRALAEEGDLEPEELRALAKGKRRSRARRHAAQVVRRVLFSEEFLAALTR